MATAKLSFLPLKEESLSQEDQAVVQLFESKSSWVWIPETSQIGEPPLAPAEQRGFRKTFGANASGQSPSTATVVISVDNYFAMYLNGALLQPADPGYKFTDALAFRVPLNGSKTVIAIRAINRPDEGGRSNPAGLRAAIGLSFPNATSQAFYTGLDQTFFGEKLIPEGWEQPDFDDRAWKPATIYSDSASPWTGIQPPTKVLVGTSVPTLPSLATTTIFVSEGSGAAGVFFPTGEFAGLIIGIVAFVTVVVGLGTFGLTRRRYKKVANAYFLQHETSHFTVDNSQRPPSIVM